MRDQSSDSGEISPHQAAELLSDLASKDERYGKLTGSSEKQGKPNRGESAKKQKAENRKQKQKAKIEGWNTSYEIKKAGQDP